MELLRTLAIILVAVITAGAAQVADVSQVATASTRTVALGASMSPGDRDQATYDTFRTAAGRAPAIWSIWSDWGGPTSAFPDVAFLNHLKGLKTVPLIIWQPVDPSNLDDPNYTFTQIADGRFDAYIRRFARAAKAFRGRVLIRFAHEMEGNWFPWSMGRFDNTPTTFKAAWKHVWNIFRGRGGVGATNVRFVWSPNGCNSIGKLSQCRKKLHSLYPGDKYVDYLGFSSFNWAGDGNRWIAMDKLFLPKVKGMAFIRTKKGLVAPDKPIIVAETSSAPKGTPTYPGTKADWIRVGYRAVYSAYPRIKAIVYFNVDMRVAGQVDWRLTGSALTAYRSLLKKTMFRGSIN